MNTTLNDYQKVKVYLLLLITSLHVAAVTVFWLTLSINQFATKNIQKVSGVLLQIFLHES